MESGMVQLGPLYKWVRKFRRQHPYDPNNSDTIAAYRIRGSPEGKKYCEECRKILDKTSNNVPNKQGFYLWGFYNPRKFWINVYCGQADKLKTAHLRDRLYKELTAERACIWREVDRDNDKLLAIGEQVHPKMWFKYKTDWERALRKAGSTHIFWVATSGISPEDVDHIEGDLIEAMNPTGNRQRRTPNAAIQVQAGKILRTFRDMIHREENRNTKFKLDYHKHFWKWVGDTKPSTP
jgi:hypothetical protein